MKREAPTEREIADLFAPAFDRVAEPDPRRLVEIEQRLYERPRRRAKLAWWLLAGGLFAGAASALWWAVNYDSAEGRKQPVPAVMSPPTAPSVAEPPVRTDRPAGAESKPAGEPADKHSPLIFKQER